MNDSTTQDDIIKFNIGGTLFSTYISTITKRIAKTNNKKDFYQANLLESLLNNKEHVKYDENKAIFIDRNPQYFIHIVDYLRLVDKYKLPKCKEIQQRIFEEAEFYQIEGLIHMLVPFKDSVILNSVHARNLTKLCGFRMCESWTLLYRGSTDGFDQKKFHAKFDGIPKTLIVAKTKNDENIFGCYTEKGWNNNSKKSGSGNEGPCGTGDQFLFSLISNEDVDFSFFDAKVSDIEVYTRFIPNIIRV